MKAIVDRVTPLPRMLAPLLLCLVGALSFDAHAAGVAMVTDLQGKATRSSGGTTSDLTICADLEAGTRLQLAAGATLVLLYLDAGDEYAFKGPSTIELKEGAPDVHSGAKPEKRSLSLGKGGKDVRIKPVGVTQGAVVMRSLPLARIQLLTLNRTRTLERAPEFRWSAPQAGAKYEFEFKDETGRILFETKVDATSLRLPASVQIKEGVPYTWEVTARLPDGRKYSSSGDFAVAGADLRAQAESLRPPASATLSTRIAYAAWLSGADLKDEARKYWKDAAAERPDDARLKALAEH